MRVSVVFAAVVMCMVTLGRWGGRRGLGVCAVVFVVVVVLRCWRAGGSRCGDGPCSRVVGGRAGSVDGDTPGGRRLMAAQAADAAM